MSPRSVETYSPKTKEPHSPQENLTILDLSCKKENVSSSCSHHSSSSEFDSGQYSDSKSIDDQSECSRESEDINGNYKEAEDINGNYVSSKYKSARPFKAYLKDPLTLALEPVIDIFGTDSSEAYAEFRKNMLEQVQSTHNATNKNMRRLQSKNADPDDLSYWEKRKRNNQAAKKSRDARRVKEDEVAIRCAFLEQENIQLTFRLAELENERQRLKKMLEA